MKNIANNIQPCRIGLKFLILSMGFSFLAGCEDFVSIDPPTTEIVGATVYTSDASATAALVGIYSDLVDRQFGIANGGPTLYGGLSSDEFQNFSTANIQFFDNSLDSRNNTVKSLWSEAYSRIFAANSVIEGLERSSAITAEVRGQLMGEALFIRAFLHFYLVNLFGDVPYITSSDFKLNTDISRMPTDDVYKHIISDLTKAKSLLIGDYSFSGGERTRPNKLVATAMLARVYLYTKEWANAEAATTEIINDSQKYEVESDLDKVFLANSAESIWQLARSQPPVNTMEGLNFILTATPTLITLSSGLLNSFEDDDQRLAHWVGSFMVGENAYNYPFKYKIQRSETIEEYYMVLRLAEQYLIRAEARAHQNKLGDAITDLDKIRERARISLIADIQPSIGQAALLDTILQERRKEFFAEWGHRWLDLKRTEQADAILKPIKEGWQPTDVLYPIPLDQILRDSNMDESDQNPGY